MVRLRPVVALALPCVRGVCRGARGCPPGLVLVAGMGRRLWVVGPRGLRCRLPVEGLGVRHVEGLGVVLPVARVRPRRLPRSRLSVGAGQPSVRHTARALGLRVRRRLGLRLTVGW